jgi:hypothetical protein
VGVRDCQSANHADDDRNVISKDASRWKCPRCKRWLCTACEGTDNGYKVCDDCWAFIERYRKPNGEGYYQRHHAVFLKLVRKYVYRNRWKEVLSDV